MNEQHKIEDIDSLKNILERIASAFEEQNRYNFEWIAIQKQWHDEAEALNEQRWEERFKLDRHIIERDAKWHEEVEQLTAQRYQEQVEREDAWRERQLEKNVEAAYQMNEHYKAAYDTYLAELKLQEKAE